MSLTLIAALTWPGRVIGRDGSLPWRLPEDLKRFKALTLGHPVLMGRKTWDSLPPSFKPLPGRRNIVLSRGSAEAGAGPAPDAWADGLERALALAHAAPGGDEVFVIGGAQLYGQALPLADRLALTLVRHPFEGDAFFPAWDRRDWAETSREPGRHGGDPAFGYDFVELRRRA